MARCQDVVTSGQPPVSVKSPLPSQWRDVSDCCPHLDPAQHCLVPGIYSSNPLGRYTTLEMLQTTTEPHWDTLHNLPVTESLNWDNLWVLISLSELGCKIRVYLCIVFLQIREDARFYIYVLVIAKAAGFYSSYISSPKRCFSFVIRIDDRHWTGLKQPKTEVWWEVNLSHLALHYRFIINNVLCLMLLFVLKSDCI